MATPSLRRHDNPELMLVFGRAIQEVAPLRYIQGSAIKFAGLTVAAHSVPLQVTQMGKAPPGSAVPCRLHITGFDDMTRRIRTRCPDERSNFQPVSRDKDRITFAPRPRAL